jgi:fructosamine-3-kinase
MFGFHIPTCHGRFAQETTWDSSWTSFFTKLLQSALAIEKQECSLWPEYEATSERILSHVIPRLLGALEEGDRNIKPSLIHGDLWEGNVGTDLSNNNIYIFDAGVYYAHHEMEIGMWRCERHKFSKLPEYKKHYLQIMGRSEPVDEFDDRNRLYCVKMNVIHSAHYPGCIERKT